MKVSRFVYAFIACFFLSSLSTADAQYYGQFDNPTLEREMTRKLLYPNAVIRVTLTQGTKKRVFMGSGTDIFSSTLPTADVCKIEEKILKDGPLCNGKTNQKHPRTYVLSVNHLFAHGIGASELNDGKDKKKEQSPTVSVTWSDLLNEESQKKLFEGEEKGESKPSDEPKTLPNSGQSPPAPLPIVVSIAVAMYVPNSDPSIPREADMQSFTAALVDYDKDNDLTLVRVNHDQTFPYVAPIAPKGLVIKPFHTVWAVGYPVNYGPMVTMGSFFPDMKMSGGIEEEYFLTSTPIYSGNSGGGLYHYSNDRNRFELIGVTRSIAASAFGPVAHVAISTPLPRVQGFLEKNHLGFLF